ncbi:hypothetical protein [Streptomyces sp. NPDC020965]|uniref:hypothetical protein n=1 Tax=Streptomyces sp. NPDC020965 TaxID=3365105 RepID=UPI0037B5D057
MTLTSVSLTAGARITGAAQCAALAAIVAGWIVHDLAALDDPLELWRFWTSDTGAPSLTTTLADPLLLAVYGTAFAAALRPTLTAGALAAAGVITLALRVPGLWVLSSSWMGPRTTDDLRTSALYATFASLGLGVGLLITAVAGGRRTLSGRPDARVPLLASIALGASAGVLTGWEIHTAMLAPDTFTERFTGGESVTLPLLGVPPGWLAVMIALLAAVSALGAVRPLGLVAGLFVLGAGIRGMDLSVRNELVWRWGELGAGDRLLVASWGLELVAGALVLLLLGGGTSREPMTRPAPRPRALGPPPPSSRPPGW